MATLDNFTKKAYYALRPIIPIRTRWYLQKRVASRINGLDSQPTWPIPAESASVVAGFSWPDNKKTALVLTHDIDSAFGFSCVDEVCAVERRLGLRSSWNIVPALYPLNEAVFGRLKDVGMEVGVHDWNHDGRLFSSKTIFDQRIGEINQAIETWAAKGFRAGMVFHNDEWMQELECEYDTSYYDTDPYQPMGGGCGQIRPFMLGHLVELPYTMPQDHVLFVARAQLKVPKEYHSEDKRRRENWEWVRRYANNKELGIEGFRNLGIKENSEIVVMGIDIWKMKAEWLVEQGGMVLMITHPDYLCHPKQRARSKKQRAMSKYIYDGWLRDDDRDVREVRESGIIENRWYGSLLEQYAAFLNWFRREYKGRYFHCLAWELAEWYRSTVKRGTCEGEKV